MINKPLVSVLITVFNDECNIGKAIESILTQTFQDFEIIIIDDGSTDNTLNVINFYVLKRNNIRVISQLNKGTTIAANNGLGYCSGKYIARLDSDDFSYPNRLMYEVNVLENNNNIALIGGGVDVIDDNGYIIGTRNINVKKPRKVLLNRCIFQQSDVMFRRDLVLALGGYREKFTNAQDYDLWLRISEKYDIIKVPEIFGVWRLNAGGYTLSRKLEQKAEIKIIKNMAKKRLKGLDDNYEEYKGMIKKFNHRNAISLYKYSYIKMQFLIKDFRREEARKIIINDFHEMNFIKKRLWLIMTYLPKIGLNQLFSLREFILNNF